MPRANSMQDAAPSHGRKIEESRLSLVFSFVTYKMKSLLPIASGIPFDLDWHVPTGGGIHHFHGQITWL